MKHEPASASSLCVPAAHSCTLRKELSQPFVHCSQNALIDQILILPPTLKLAGVVVARLGVHQSSDFAQIAAEHQGEHDIQKYAANQSYRARARRVDQIRFVTHRI